MAMNTAQTKLITGTEENTKNLDSRSFLSNVQDESVNKDD